MNNALPVFTDFVDGEPATADQNASGIDLIAPQSGQTIATIAEFGKAGVDRAVNAASAAFAAHRKQPTHQRIAWLNTTPYHTTPAGCRMPAHNRPNIRVSSPRTAKSRYSSRPHGYTLLPLSHRHHRLRGDRHLGQHSDKRSHGRRRSNMIAGVEVLFVI